MTLHSSLHAYARELSSEVFDTDLDLPQGKYPRILIQYNLFSVHIYRFRHYDTESTWNERFIT